MNQDNQQNFKPQKSKGIGGWIQGHLIHTWVMASIAFAIIIHVSFWIPAPCGFLQHQWEAGDVLTYASTVALGLLAVWQNQKYKKDNDVLQQRLEKLTSQANEYSIVSKIIEYETNNLSSLKKAFDTFSAVCDPQNLTSAYASEAVSSQSAVTISIEMTKMEKRLDDSFLELSRELRMDSSLCADDSNPFKKSLLCYYSAAKAFIDKSRIGPSSNITLEQQKLIAARDEFLKQRESLISVRQKMLESIIYGNLPLDAIKRMYHEELKPSKDV